MKLDVRADEGLMKAALNRSRAMLRDFKEQGLTNALWAFAKVEMGTVALMGAGRQPFAEFRGKSFAQAVWRFAVGSHGTWACNLQD